MTQLVQGYHQHIQHLFFIIRHCWSPVPFFMLAGVYLLIFLKFLWHSLYMLPFLQKEKSFPSPLLWQIPCTKGSLNSFCFFLLHQRKSHVPELWQLGGATQLLWNNQSLVLEEHFGHTPNTYSLHSDSVPVEAEEDISPFHCPWWAMRLAMPM